MKQIGLAVLLLFIGVQSSRAVLTFGGGAHLGMSAWGYKYQFVIDPKNQDVSVFGAGFIFGGHAELGVNKYLAARLSIDYSMYSPDNEALKDVVFRYWEPANPGLDRSQVGVEGNKASVFAVTVNGIGKYPLGEFSPYVLLGIGIHAASFSEAKALYANQSYPNASAGLKIDGKTSFCFNAGVGAEYKLRFMKLFLEIYYGYASGSAYLPIMIGVTLP